MQDIHDEVGAQLDTLCPGQVIWITTPYGRLPTLAPGQAVPASRLVAGTVTQDDLCTTIR